MGKEKKGLFEKLGLIERTETESPPEEYYDESYEEPTEPEVEASLNEVNTNTLINDIYVENGIMEKSKSIYKIQDVLGSLPKEMPTDAKRTTVISLLGNFGLTVTEVTDDGEKRIAILRKIQNDINTESNELITDYENQIEHLKEEIANKEKLIAEEKDKKSKCNTTIDTELETVQKLIDFIIEEE